MLVERDFRGLDGKYRIKERNCGSWDKEFTSYNNAIDFIQRNYQIPPKCTTSIIKVN
jgi:hypothetical protein